MTVEVHYPTEAEKRAAADAAQDVIRVTEGGRMIVLAETMALLTAYYAAQMRDRGVVEPMDAAGDFLLAVLEKAIEYDDAGIIGRSH